MTDRHAMPVFDLGVTMAGAISAGAYSAGVLDFLIEALDAWEAARANGSPDAPPHAVCIKAFSGASAGSLCAAILAAALRYDFPHVRNGVATGGEANPLFDAWVKQIDMAGLLDTRDIQPGVAPLSVLDSTRLLEIAERAIDYGTGQTALRRPYLADPLRFAFTVTNLRGVPFAMDLKGEQACAQAMAMYGDAMRFALTSLGGCPGAPLRHDERLISYPVDGPKWATWAPFAHAALASGAFPVGLAPRELTRPVSDYDKLPIIAPDEDGKATLIAIQPTWSSLNPKPAGGDYRFVCVDGGAINNEPFELARIEVAGSPLRRNPRKGCEATGAVLMIDPFTGPEAAGASSLDGLGLMRIAGGLVSALKNQARFKPQDLALAHDDTIYSRFLIAPTSSRAAGAESASAIACGSLGGFGGFFAERYREHDFFLGRRNCQAFLWRHFTLPMDNPLFDGWRDNAELVRRYVRPARAGGQTELPIIPLMPRLHPELGGMAEPEPPWPKAVCSPDAFRPALRKRLDAVVQGMAASVANSWLERAAVRLALWRFGPKAVDRAVEAIRDGLRKHDLL